MISRGDAEINRIKAAEYGITFPIILQKQWEISRAYGIFATPSGYLVDERGIIATDVAVCEHAILQLVDRTWGMHDRVKARLSELKSEYDKGLLRIQQAERELSALRETVSRINGAILVLEELLKPATVHSTPRATLEREKTSESTTLVTAE